MSHPECAFCGAFVASSPIPWNRPLLETPHFQVVPSLGALVEGWVLIVSREHAIRTSDLPTDARRELDDLRGRLGNAVTKGLGKSVVQFEHGAACTGIPIGCGVDHAHVHLVPFDGDVVTEARTQLPEIEWNAAGSLGSVQGSPSLSYIYVEDANGLAVLAERKELPSQLLRRCIASLVGRSNEWNWRDRHQERNVSATIQLLKDLESWMPETLLSK